MKVFDQDDKLYFIWIKDNPSGFVVNTERRPNSRYFMLHKSYCQHISSYEGISDGAYTGRQYIKVCSNDISELKIWFSSHKPNFVDNFKECRTCNSMNIPSTIKDINLYPDTINDTGDILYEGAKMKITVNSFERNEAARKKCLMIYGYSCSICKIDFEKTYGNIGKEFIHVHHLREISDIGKEYVINPQYDLIPICPNCHSMIHQRKPCFTINEMREIYLKQIKTNNIKLTDN